MIHVDRSSAPEPKIFRSSKVGGLREKAHAHYMGPDGAKKPHRFDTSWYSEIRDPLSKLFHGKCAYCESVVSTGGDIELFRPKARAMQLDGHIGPGYWWLAHEWSNIYLSCEACNRRFKRNRFPVDGRRARNVDELPKERALLLDPCLERDFEEGHFAYVHSEERGVDMVGVSPRGEATVEVLGLNRLNLRASRAREWQRFESILKETPSESPFIIGALLPDPVQDALAPNQSYLAMKHQQLRDHFKRPGMPEIEAAIQQEYAVFTAPVVSKAEASRAHESRMAEQSKYSVLDDSKAHKERYFGGLKLVERVEMRNFRLFEELAINFPKAGGEEEAAWLTLIGENASGKSTLLKAVALTLMGAEERDKLDLDPVDYITHGRASAEVRVHLTNIDEPLVLTITRKPAEFRSSVEDPLVLILGYGSTRLLRSFKDDASRERQLIRSNNLFDPYQKLNHVEKWLADTSLVPTGQFNLIRGALMDLLLLDQEADVIWRRDGRVFVRLAEERYRLDQLSDGYQSVLALALDIMLVLVEKWASIKDAEGIVLIDEIGVHLHPRWRMQITQRLKRTFPGLQFIVTTHEPLCLRSLEANEVVLMRRNEDSGVPEAVTDLPSPANFRVDQLLTSSFFGLSSAMDPETEAAFNEYYMLLARKRPSATEKKRIAELEEELRDRRHLGSTPRDEIMYDVIDRLLAKDQQEGLDQPIAELKDEAVKLISERWKAQFAKS